MDTVDNLSVLPDTDKLEEKIIDALNYLVLLEAMVKEGKMTLIANVPYDEGLVKYLKLFAEVEHETFKWCKECGWPFVTCKRYQEDICVECSGTNSSWNVALRQEQQEEYMKKISNWMFDETARSSGNQTESIKIDPESLSDTAEPPPSQREPSPLRGTRET